MSEFDQNIPDDLWRKAFEDAAETPAPRVWDAIERRLDEDNGPKILPLWGTGLASSRPFIWGTGMAAAVALLLVGWWASHPPVTDKPVAHYQPSKRVEQPIAGIMNQPVNPLARNQSPKQAGQVAAVVPKVPKSIATDCWPAWKTLPKRPARSAQQQLSEDIAQNQKPVASPSSLTQARPIPSSPVVTLTPPLTRPEANLPEQSGTFPVAATPDPASTIPADAAKSHRMAQQTVVASTFRTGTPKNTRMVAAGTTPPPIDSPMNRLQSATALSSAPTLLTENGQALSVNRLQTRAVRLREPRSIQRIVWLRPAEQGDALETDKIQPKQDKREVWASASMMPGAFNPSVAVRSVQSSYVNVSSLSNTSTSQPAVSSRANFSMAYQAGAGIQLSEHWSVESGVGYLTARSTVESPVQASVLNFQSVTAGNKAQTANLYVDALRNTLASTVSASANSLASFDYIGASSRYTVQNNYNPQSRQSLTNDYQFVQVPVQVGYQLRPRKRLGLALLGGFLSNIFVRNTVADELVISAKDGVYRPVSWAATMGARFRYRPSRQWSASLAGVYQPSLGFGTKPESSVQTRPTSTGLSFGIDYHF